MRFVDLFAGVGGFTLAAERVGGQVVYAANHWPLAVEAHALNHPRTIHVCQDLRQADWTALPSYDVLLAAPACPGSSPAGQPGRKRSARVRKAHDALRATAWAIIDCAGVTLPRVIVVENVPAFGRWTAPGSRDVGAVFRHWCGALELYGYRVYSGLLTASRCSDTPQRRTRLFVVAVRGRRRAGEDAIFDVPRLPEPAFGPCIDWDAARWRLVERASSDVKERIRRSRERHGGAVRFLTQHTRDHYGVPLTQPIRTITTKDQWAVVDGPRYRSLTLRESMRAQGFPDDHKLPRAGKRETIKLIGNAVPVALGEVVIERACGLI